MSIIKKMPLVAVWFCFRLAHGCFIGDFFYTAFSGVMAGAILKRYPFMYDLY